MPIDVTPGPCLQKAAALVQVQVEVLSKAAEEADVLRSQVLHLQQLAVEQAGPHAGPRSLLNWRTGCRRQRLSCSRQRLP